MKIKLHPWEQNLFHVIGKTGDGEPWPLLSMDDVWEVFSEALDFIHEDGVEATHAFLLMNNHYHWICDFDFDNDSGILDWFHELINLGFLKRSEICLDQILAEPSVYRINHIKQYQTTYRYIYRNPLEAGLVVRAENYPFSTLPYVLGKPGLKFLCVDHMNAIHAPAQLLRWLNFDQEYLCPLPT